MRGTRSTVPAAALILLVAAAAPATAQEPEAGEGLDEAVRTAERAVGERELVVGVKESPPFAIQGRDGSWRGAGIDLWRAVASTLGLDWRWEERSLQELQEGLHDGSLDVVASSLTITADREARFDFSHPFYNAGLGIAVVPEARSGWTAALRGIFSMRMLKGVGGLAVVLLVAGALLWLLERRRNEAMFGGPTLQGLGSGFWWSAVTMTTVGYGDKVPITRGGKLVALVWMFTSVIIVSSFTAAIASALTVGRLELPIEGPRDLPGATVGTVAASTSEAFLERRGVRDVRTWEDIDEALDALGAGEVDAVVYDTPILRHLNRRAHGERFEVVEAGVEPQDYAFGLPERTELREPINRVLLQRTSSAWWRDMLDTYVGK